MHHLKSANDAGIQSIVTLNTSPLDIDDFKELISEDRIFQGYHIGRENGAVVREKPPECRKMTSKLLLFSN